ncbi:YncE family protein [Paenibacillus chitinolyticus]|uniref:hypothetical protein n=1 Tax=Paenibacillus chitinolyticus TaxID=79263 RepID=UPI00295E539E|nr:hypothetical protein [Paenibacillus chitinolyticus]
MGNFIKSNTGQEEYNKSNKNNRSYSCNNFNDYAYSVGGFRSIYKRIDADINLLHEVLYDGSCRKPSRKDVHMNITKVTASSALPTAPTDVSARWRTVIPGNMGHRLWLDTEKNRVLVSDGWGVAFSALRLRALDLNDGRELASARLGNVVRALVLDADGSWLAATDTKLFRLDRSDLRLITKWTSRIPKYSDNLVAGAGFVHAVNNASAGLYAINLATGAVKRRLLDEDVQIHAADDTGLIAVCGNGSLWRADFGLAAALRRSAQLPAICDSAVDRHGRLWLSLGQGRRRESNRVSWAEPTAKLGLFDLSAGNNLVEVELGLPFWQIAVSSNGEKVSVSGVVSREIDGQIYWSKTDVACYRTSNYECMSWVRVPEGFEVQSVWPERNLAFATKMSEQDSDCAQAELICFSL